MASSSPYFLYLILLFLLPVFVVAQTYQKIELGSSLTAALNINSSWRSPSGDFAFGFQQIRAGEFLLAIWFDNIPEKTIIWSPPIDGEKLVEEGSKIQLSEDGQFRLTDARGEKVWDAQLTGSGNVLYAAMFDTGNFVLVSQDSNLWESFNQPTDTIVPTQIMKRNSKLVARYAEKNYSRGRFRFRMQGDGNLVFYVTSFLWDTVDLISRAYWASNTVNQGYQFVFNQSGYIYLADNNGSILYSFTSKETSSTNYYQRVILEYDGVLRHYVYPKTNNGTARNPMNWSMQRSEPSNICDIKETQGSGACGYNSYCSFGDDQRPKCSCPPGYSFFDPDDKMRGCKQDFDSLDCNRNQDADDFELREMANMDWPQTDYAYFKGVTEDWCRQTCLTDCFCPLAVFKDDECTMKKFPLSNGRMDPGLGGKTLIKIRKDNSTNKSPDKGSREGSTHGSAREGSTYGSNKDRSTLILALTMLLSSSSFFNLVLLIATLWLASRLSYWKRRMLQPSRANQGTSLRSFTYKELEEATNKFKEELGKGACSTVYRGVLDTGNKNMVAIKKLDKIVTESELEFQAEISAISKTNHKNLVQLLGFCNEGQHRLLVYEYMSNGSLASYLFGNLRPSWYQRALIAFGTARGLVYLHEECSNQIIHCDIKPQNILLDDSLTARISDFGLAKLLKTGQTRTVTAIRGTKGYVAPEWFKNKPVTIKVDVYSFGILLLELICCRRSFEQDLEDENQMILADWAYDCYEEGRLYLLVQEDEEAIQDIKRVERFVMIAIWCIQDDPSSRPTMKRVSQMLEGAVEVPRPPSIPPVNV
ncbi:hypothetical protein SLE2022_356790 [Rubroshorea leprosula]